MARSSSSSSSSNDGSDWEEEEGGETVGCPCLFCSFVSHDGAHLLLDHCSQDHSFDIREYARKMSKCNLLCSHLSVEINL